MLYRNLNPEKALIWRIVHRDNLPWILDNGLHCCNSNTKASSWVDIGNPELIDKRAHRTVPLSPYGYLSDYVPFYFTPFSPMLYNIHTGRGGVRQRINEEICILVSSVHKVRALKLDFVFTDRHAYPQTSRYFNDVVQLCEIDWPLLQTRNFKRNPDDPEQIERYQAEALVYQQMPIDALLGIICYNDSVRSRLEILSQAKGLELKVLAKPEWYFP